MRQTRQDDEKDAERAAEISVKVFLAVFALCILVTLIGYYRGWFGESLFGEPEMVTQNKYRQLKAATAQLEKMQVDITFYEELMAVMNETYKDRPRYKWSREDREQCNVWKSEVAGLRESYNELAVGYNAWMARFKWRFANVGDLPKGADKPLPREFKPYTTQ